MKNMAFTALSLATLLTLAETSTPAGWTDDFEAALKQAKAEKKHVLVDFSGSDWCGWCQRLDKEVFDTEVFRAGAKDKYVLVMIDSPRNQSLLTDAAKEQNPKLVKQFAVHGYPSVFVLDADGNKLLKTGYQRGGPEKYLEMLDREIKDAPDVIKYITPIERILNAPAEAFEKTCEEIQETAMKKFKGLGTTATKKEREAVMTNARAVFEQQFFEKVASQHIPLLEKAIAEAKAVQVPANMNNRKTSLIARSQSLLDNLRTELEKYKSQKSASANK